jgi:hypothetical protein
MASEFLPNDTIPTAVAERKGSILRQRADVPAHAQHKVIRVEELSDADAQLALQFGYNPVFKREFGYLSAFSFSVSISGLFATVMTTFSFPLTAGGSASAVWCWLISGAGCMCIAVSGMLYSLRGERPRWRGGSRKADFIIF